MATVVGRSEKLWFLDTLVTVRVPVTAGSDGISVLEHHAPHGDSPPLHVHSSEDEIFHVLEGDLLLQLEGEKRSVGPGETVLVQKGTRHTYRVQSTSAKWLTVTGRGDFENFVREMARAAEVDELPIPAGPPSDEEIVALIKTAGRYRIEIVGPPLR